MIKPTDCLWARNGNAQCPEALYEQFQQVGWAISYDGGKTPYKMWKGEEAHLDNEIKWIGGTASKMTLYAKVEK